MELNLSSHLISHLISLLSCPPQATGNQNGQARNRRVSPLMPSSWIASHGASSRENTRHSESSLIQKRIRLPPQAPSRLGSTTACVFTPLVPLHRRPAGYASYKLNPPLYALRMPMPMRTYRYLHHLVVAAPRHSLADHYCRLDRLLDSPAYSDCNPHYSSHPYALFRSKVGSVSRRLVPTVRVPAHAMHTLCTSC